MKAYSTFKINFVIFYGIYITWLTSFQLFNVLMESGIFCRKSFRQMDNSPMDVLPKRHFVESFFCIQNHRNCLYLYLAEFNTFCFYFPFLINYFQRTAFLKIKQKLPIFKKSIKLVMFRRMQKPQNFC